MKSDGDLRRYFTLEEARAGLSSVRTYFDTIVQLRTHAKRLHSRLESAGYPAEVDEDGQIQLCSSDGIDMDSEPPPASVLRCGGMLRAVYETLHEEIARVHETGAVIRDLDEGTVIWLAQHNGREILLCWRYGDGGISFWLDPAATSELHRPLSELGLEEP